MSDVVHVPLVLSWIFERLSLFSLNSWQHFASDEVSPYKLEGCGPERLLFPANFRVFLPRGSISAVHGIFSVALKIRLQITVDWQHQISGFYDRCILVHVIVPCLGILLLSNVPSFLQKSPFFINTKISSLTSNLPGLLNWRKSNPWKDGLTSW